MACFVPEVFSYATTYLTGNDPNTKTDLKLLKIIVAMLQSVSWTAQTDPNAVN
jgi:hypothetical protein